MKIKINAVNFFNRVIDAVSALLEEKECPNCEVKIEVDYETECNVTGIDYGCQIIHKYLQEIGERAIVLNDPVIIESLVNLGILTCDEAEEKTIIEHSKAIKAACESGVIGRIK